MSTSQIFVDEQGLQIRPPSRNQGFFAWGDNRAQTFANFTREIHDFPNATVSIDVAGSGSWLQQLAGITSGTVNVVAGSNATEPIYANQIVGTGVYFEGGKSLCAQQTARVMTGIVGGLQPGYFAGTPVFVSPEPIRLMANVHQMTMVEQVDAAALTQIAVANKYALLARLRRIQQLQQNWDGEQASPISEQTANKAEEVIDLILRISLQFSKVPTVRLGPLADGTVRFECIHSNKELFLTIADDSVEVQAWQPLEAIESVGYWKTDPRVAWRQLEWLVK